ncbi:MAG: hypothetical protein ACOY99_00935 [Pseudomonadota bacterium]|jgi:hypothetical protein
MDRVLVILLWLFVGLSLLNGMEMLVLPRYWYTQTPGVAEAGAFNIHFIRDIGIAFLTASLALGWGLARPRWRRPMLLIALIWFGGHAALHGVEIAWSSGYREGLWVELAAIIAPSLLMLILFWRTPKSGAA